jgi:hypothetical protein
MCTDLFVKRFLMTLVYAGFIAFIAFVGFVAFFGFLEFIAFALLPTAYSLLPASFPFLLDSGYCFHRLKHHMESIAMGER